MHINIGAVGVVIQRTISWRPWGWLRVSDGQRFLRGERPEDQSPQVALLLVSLSVYTYSRLPQRPKPAAACMPGEKADRGDRPPGWRYCFPGRRRGEQGMDRLGHSKSTKKKPGTLKSYLTSFELFLDYVLMKGTRPHLPEWDPEVKKQLSDLCKGLKKWWRCINKETTSVKWDRYLNESDQLLTNDEVEDILTSKPAVDGRAALLAADQAEGTEHLSTKQYCDARDFLIVTLTRAVGTKPAALAFLKMPHWRCSIKRNGMTTSKGRSC